MFVFDESRYSRQLAMPEWGGERQERLAEARVGVIGAGGVKSTMLMALVAAGVGHITVIDHDRVELTNLNRQLLYTTEDIGRYKVEATRDMLVPRNPEVDICAINEKVVEGNIDDLLAESDFIVEGGDSPAGRNLVNRYCLGTGKPYVHASAQFSYGYVFSVVPSWSTACFACFFPSDHTRTNSTGPVPVNVLSTSIAGSLGAGEVLKWFMGYHEQMITNRRLCFSSLLLSEEFTYELQPRRPDCPVCGNAGGGKEVVT